MDIPTLSTGQAQLAVSKMLHPRVTELSIRDGIMQVDYLYKDLLTICVLTMDNGFMVHGVSAAASPQNHDEAVGKRYAYDNAFKQLWQLEGYLLRDRLHHAGL